MQGARVLLSGGSSWCLLNGGYLLLHHGLAVMHETSSYQRVEGVDGGGGGGLVAVLEELWQMVRIFPAACSITCYGWCTSHFQQLQAGTLGVLGCNRLTRVDAG